MQAVNGVNKFSTTQSAANSATSIAPKPIPNLSPNSIRSTSQTQRLSQPARSKAELENDFLKAAEQGDTVAVVSLLKYVDINVSDGSGKTALWKASCAGNKEIVISLIENGATIDKPDLAVAYKRDGVDIYRPNSTPLHIAAINGHTEIVTVLIKNGASVNCSNQHGFTPLHNAAGNGHTKTVLALLESGADINEAAFIVHTPLLMAAIKGHVETVQFLLNLGADAQEAIRKAKFIKYQDCANPIVSLLEEELGRFQYQQRQGLVHAPLPTNATPLAIAQRVDDVILSSNLSDSFSVQLNASEIDYLRVILENRVVFTQQQADQLEAIHVDWQALFKGLEGLNDQQKLYFQAFASGLSQAYLLSKIIPSGMLEVLNPGQSHLDHAGWAAAKAAMTLAMPKFVRGAEKIASEIPCAGLMVSGATSLYLYHMETKVLNRQVLISECVINELSMDLFANKLARSLVEHSTYQTLLSELNDKALEQKNPQRFKRLMQVKNIVKDGLEKFNLKARTEFDNPIGHQAIQDVAQVLKQMGKNQALRSALQNQQTDDAVAIMRELLIESSTAATSNTLSLVQTTTSQTIMHSYTSTTYMNSNSQPGVDPQEFKEVKEQLTSIIDKIDPSTLNTVLNITGVTQQHGALLREKLIQIEKLDLRAELFGDLKDQGIDLTELLNRIKSNVDDLQNQQSDLHMNARVFNENMSQVDLVLARIENLTIKNGRKIARLEEVVETQQQQIQTQQDEMQAHMQELRNLRAELQARNQAPVQQVNTQCCEIM